MLNEKDLELNRRYIALAMEDNTVEFFDPGSAPLSKLEDATTAFDVVLQDESIKVDDGWGVGVSFEKLTKVTPSQAVILVAMMVGQMEAARE